MSNLSRQAPPTTPDVLEPDEANVSVTGRQNGRSSEPNRSRRRFLQAAGAVAVGTVLTGCLGGGGDGDTGGNGTAGSGDATATEAGDESTPTEGGDATTTDGDDATVTEGGEATTTEDGDATATDGGDTTASEGGSSVIESGRIVLRAESNSWVGEEPSSIRDQQNPTLRIQESQEYELVQVNTDGREHELVIGDGAGEDIVETPSTEQSGATAQVTFQADQRMSTYYCYYHSETERGTIEVTQ